MVDSTSKVADSRAAGKKVDSKADSKVGSKVAGKKVDSKAVAKPKTGADLSGSTPVCNFLVYVGRVSSRISMYQVLKTIVRG